MTEEENSGLPLRSEEPAPDGSPEGESSAPRPEGTVSGTRETEAAAPQEVVETYIQPTGREIVERYIQPRRLPGRRPSLTAPPRKKKRRKGPAILLACLAIAAALGAGVWLLRDRPPETPPSDSAGQVEEETSEEITIPTAEKDPNEKMTLTTEHGEELTAQEIYARVNPSAVTVVVSMADGQSLSVGTGVIFSADGYLLTNYHVLAGGAECKIYLADGTPYDAAYVAGDSDNDVAVLKVDGTDLPAAEIGDSDALAVGDKVYAIGNPLGVELRGTFTDGIVSAINRDVKVDERTMTLIQTNAALNNGNSGGPLINRFGQVVGINTIKMSSSYSTIEGLGFALPTSSVVYLVNDLLTYGEIQPEPVLGLSVSRLPTTLSDGTEGIEILDVTAGSAAEAAGLREGDVLVSADGTPVASSAALLRLRRAHRLGDTMTVQVWRDGAYLDMTLHLTQALNAEG